VYNPSCSSSSQATYSKTTCEWPIDCFIFACVLDFTPPFHIATRNTLSDSLQVAARGQMCRDLPFVLKACITGQNRAMNVVVKWRDELIWIIMICNVSTYVLLECCWLLFLYNFLCVLEYTAYVLSDCKNNAMFLQSHLCKFIEQPRPT